MKKVLTIAGVLAFFSGYAQQKDSIQTHNLQRDELEEVVIQGNRLDTPFDKINRDIQVVTQKQIEALPVKSLNEVLSYISGVDIRQRGQLLERKLMLQLMVVLLSKQLCSLMV